MAFTSYRRHPGQCYYQADSDPGGEPTTCTDIYRYNFATNQTVLVTATRNGAATNGPSYDATMSGDGRYVAFISTATNFYGPAVQPRGGYAQVYVKDAAPIGHDPVLVSASPTGKQGDHSTWDARISGDGKWVVFDSTAKNLAPEGAPAECDRSWDTSGFPSPCHEIFLRDLVGKRTIRITTSLTGGQPNGDSVLAHVSADGSIVEFLSRATNLTPERAAGTFVWTRSDGKIHLIPGSPMAFDGGNAILSRDGSTVVFTMATPGHQAIYRYDVATHATTKITDQSPPASLDDVSADGKTMLIGFQSGNTYLRDPAGRLTLVSRWPNYFYPVMDATGSFVAFDSSSTDIVLPDPNGRGADVYRRDVANKTTQRVPR